MYGYIYITTNLINGKKYIGKHKATEFTDSYKGSGIALWNAIKKYGWDNFKVEFIRGCNNLEELNNAEIEEITKHNAVLSENYYNISGGGTGWSASWENPEFRKMMHERLSGENNPSKREEVRAKMRKPHPSARGKNNPSYGGLSEEHKKKLSESRIKLGIAKGKKNPMYGKRGKDNPNYGRIHVNDGVHFITIPKEQFEEYSKQGYIKTKNPGNTAYCYMNNGTNSIRIFKTEVDYWLNLGWLRGKKNCPINNSLKSSSTIESVTTEKSCSE